MAIIHYAVCIRNVWKLGSTLNSTNILQKFILNVYWLTSVLNKNSETNKKYFIDINA